MKNVKRSKKDKSQKRKKQALAGASGLALIALLSGTFAWLNARDERINRLESLAVSDGSVAVEEQFDPTPIQAGGSAKKEVIITNGGSAPVFVRTSFEEVLKHLKGDAAETAVSNVWTAPKPEGSATKPTAAKSAGVGYDVPVAFNAEKYTSAAAKTEGWKDITSQITPAPPSHIKVVAKGNYRLDAATNKEVQDFEYVMYAEYETGKYQKVTGDLQIATQGGAATTAGADVSKWTFSMASNSIKYYVYKDGYDVNTVNWALNTLNDADDQKTGAALLGTQGTRNGKVYDYRNQTKGGIIPDANLNITPAAILATVPTPTANVVPIQADDKGKIKLNFDSTQILDPAATLVAGKWVYNETDGWFYYTKALPGGQSTGKLLDSVDYASTIGTEYSNATYDLVVKMEAVQAVKEALTDDEAGGFGLDPASSIYDIMSKNIPTS